MIKPLLILQKITFFYLAATSSFQKHSSANDSIDIISGIKGYETLVSSGGRFELGFFSPGKNSNNWYIGIWYKNATVRSPVWVANRENPVRNNITSSSSAAALKIIEPGILVVVDEADNIVWSSNTSTTVVQNPIAQLLESGNLVLRDSKNERPEDYLWQSFDYLTDTFLPDMDAGWNYMNGKERYLSSWRSNDDPAPGDFTHHLDVTGYPQGITRRGEAVVYRRGPWNGLTFSGAPNGQHDPAFKYGVYAKNGTFVYRMESIDRSVLSRVTLSPTGVLQRWTWVDRLNTWALYHSIAGDYCDNYKLCGAHGICNNAKSPVCACLDKFVPRDPHGWARADWSNGCVRRTQLNCSEGHGFLRHSNVKLPDARTSWHNESMTIKECKVECLKNCSCMAYTNLDIRGRGSGCIMWFGDLVDMRVLSADGQDLYIRVASSELESDGRGKQVLVPSITTIGAVMLALFLVTYLWKRKKIDYAKWRRGKNDQCHEDLELPFFDLKAISRATTNFSIDNKLGEGGYGPVYKGLLEEGNYIAVKRLSATSRQGLEEFKNEVNCISKLQHRNLVKLLGYCINGEEKMLIYEYMPNKSLDYFLFGERANLIKPELKNIMICLKRSTDTECFADEKYRKFLDSQKRLQIVNGIARGLLYLHQDSRLRIVHRDLKASNILLDKDMNPKISDFGLARCFKDNETEDKTKRVAGTYGYMSPEYAVRGRFSIKSDVFSFGVLVLEIVSGTRNSSFDCGGRNINLLGHAWMLHREGRSREFVDSYLRSTDNIIFDMLRLIRVGLLCVQHSPDDRPTMSSVVWMLSSGNASITPKEPGFFTQGDSQRIEMKNKSAGSRNELTNTILDGR